ncbi:hypothetical protein GCM10022222_57620 [Amycolatopsis ultiminotia]|uniref:Uncharacterized protein n=1 Tax=Amycolatopsis ultiminotia TaxID=543629 RepID=A0ABP6XH11_9PSEU
MAGRLLVRVRQGLSLGQFVEAFVGERQAAGSQDGAPGSTGGIRRIKLNLGAAHRAELIVTGVEKLRAVPETIRWPVLRTPNRVAAPEDSGVD